MATNAINILAHAIEAFQPCSQESWAETEMGMPLIEVLEIFLATARKLNESDNYIIEEDDSTVIGGIIVDIRNALGLIPQRAGDAPRKLLLIIAAITTAILKLFDDREDEDGVEIQDFVIDRDYYVVHMYDVLVERMYL
jgi:hypothetical protein